MLYYWIIFLLCVLGLFSPVSTKGVARSLLWSTYSIVLILFIGFRYKVGGDWDNYLDYYQRVSEDGYSFVFGSGRSIAYALVNWLASTLDWGIYGVNVICGVLFISGLMYFCSKQPLPWLACLIALPYLVFVVSMGYTRQSVAIGLIMFGLVQLDNRRLWLYLAFVAMATLFHNSAVVLVFAPLMLLDRNTITVLLIKVRKTKIFHPRSIIIALMGTISIVYLILNADSFFSLVKYYVYGELWSSSGALIRISMNAVAGITLIVFRKRWRNVYGKPRLWIWISSLSILSIPFVFFMSTPVDRIGLYLVPLQLYVLSRLPLIFASHVLRSMVVFGLVSVYSLVLWTWLNYANHSSLWVPYRNFYLS